MKSIPNIWKNSKETHIRINRSIVHITNSLLKVNTSSYHLEHKKVRFTQLRFSVDADNRNAAEVNTS